MTNRLLLSLTIAAAGIVVTCVSIATSQEFKSSRQIETVAHTGPGGHVQVMVIEPQEAGKQIRAGNLPVIAALTEKRLASLPNVPTIKEQGIDVPLIPQARGVLAPPAASKEVVQYWESVFDAFVKTSTWKQYVEQNQFEDAYLKGAALNKFLDALQEQMREVLKEAGAKVVR